MTSLLLRRGATFCGLIPLLFLMIGWDRLPEQPNLPSVDDLEGSQETWTLEPSPAVSIGLDVGEAEYLFYMVRSALLLPDGRIIVGDNGAKEIRCFDAEGRFLWTSGRAGQGPGEFSGGSTMYLFNAHVEDWIVVDDSGSGRVNVIDSDGVLVRSVRLLGAPNAPRGSLWGSFADGSWLVRAPDRGGRVAPEIRAEPGRVFSLGQQYHRYSGQGEPISLLARTSGRLRMVDRLGDMTHHPYMPFAPAPQVASFGDRLWVTNGADPEVEAYDLNGRVVARVRWNREAEPLTRDTFESYRQRMLALVGEYTQPANDLYRHFYQQDLPLPEYVPLYTSMLIDSEGNLWLKRFRPRYPQDDLPSQWDVVDQDRGWVATVETPPRFTVYQVGGDSILGLHQDEGGTQRVQVYKLRR